MSEWETFYPLSFRLLTLLNVGIIYYFGIIYIGHQYYSMNIIKILHLQIEYNTNNVLINNTRQFVRAITSLNFLSYLFYRFCIKVTGNYWFVLEIIPDLLIIFNIYYLLINGENRLLSILQRILIGKIDVKSLRTNDILLSDSLTSYSKILLDFANYLNYIFYFGKDNFKKLNETFGIDLIILVLPQLIRLSQCWREYEYSKRRNRQSFLNFLKYSSNVLPILMIFITRHTEPQNGYILMIEKLLILINSLYTFIWDIFIDWNFKMIKSYENGKFNDNIFKASIIFDFSLRFFWLWKFIFTNSSVFYYFNDSDPGIILFIMQFLEITRRFIWCIHRLNTEAIADSVTNIEMTKF